MLINKLLNFIVPSTVFFEDGSRVEHLSRNDTLRYVSPSGCIIQVTLLYDKKANELHVDMPFEGKWEKPAGQSLTEKEMSDLAEKISAFVAKKGKPFII